jgi:hypothetical protein
MLSQKERLTEDLRPIVVKYRRVLNSIELMEVLRDALLAEANDLPNRALDRALARGLSVREAAKQEEGGNISADEAARSLSISKTSVLEKFKKGQLLGWRETRQKAVRFPVWQFAEGEILAGVPEVLAILSKAPEIDDWGRVMFFLNRRNSLRGMRPLDALREGKVAEVQRLAWGDVEP